MKTDEELKNMPPALAEMYRALAAELNAVESLKVDRTALSEEIKEHKGNAADLLSQINAYEQQAEAPLLKGDFRDRVLEGLDGIAKERGETLEITDCKRRKTVTLGQKPDRVEVEDLPVADEV